jgi:hypothetical protein
MEEMESEVDKHEEEAKGCKVDLGLHEFQAGNKRSRQTIAPSPLLPT